MRPVPDIRERCAAFMESDSWSMGVSIDEGVVLCVVANQVYVL